MILPKSQFIKIVTIYSEKQLETYHFKFKIALMDIYIRSVLPHYYLITVK
jgi:hypothetical protein